jgi:diguanylate cyclase (GGDEF)-like protein
MRLANKGQRREEQGPSPLRFMFTMMAIVFSVELAIMLAFTLLPELPDTLATLLDATTLTLVAGALSWWTIGRPFRTALTRHTRARRIDSAIGRALDMADSEEEVHAVLARTLETAVPDCRGELLLADSSHAHLRLAVDSPRGDGPGCGVDTPAGCPAVRRGHPLVFGSPHDIDACPRLADRPHPVGSAVCIPVAVLGRAAGVLHATVPEGADLEPESVETLQLLGAGLGSRLGMVRALSESAVAAATDPLTGLLNRRSLEARVAHLERNRDPYVVDAFDLDHFKNLNDTHGHLTGDQALRLFARVLRSCTRDNDLAARMGGEEFLVVLPGATSDEGMALGDRIRVELIAALSDGTVPGFTVSVGVADDRDGDTFEQIVAAADRRLYTSKTTGRDRVTGPAVALPT